MFEHRHERLLPRAEFIKRVARGFATGAVIILGSLGIGTAGYHFFEGLPWLDALVNASMILFGEGPLAELQTTGGKWFATFYAMFSGVAFITIVGVMFAPMVHRFLHRFHLGSGEDEQRTEDE